MKRRQLHPILFFVFVAVLLIAGIWLARLEIEGALADIVLRYGYVGYFFAAFVAGINVLVPITHLIFTIPLLNIGLNPWILGLVGALGATLADTIGYGIGHTGRAAFPKIFDQLRQRTESMMIRFPHIAPVILFLWAAFVPLPNEFLVIPAGLIAFGFARTMIITLAGNLFFNFFFVYFSGLIFVR